MAAPDVLVVGSGHNALVAAAYLARAGLRVSVHERRPTFGGAVASARVFPGVDASLSRFSYLVSLLPRRLVTELGLDLELRSRPVASYTPVGTGGLLVERREGPATRAAFRELTGGGDEYAAWQRFHHDVAVLAAAVAPTLTEPLPRAADLRARVGAERWRALVEEPLGTVLERTFSHDAVRGTLLTDGLIGTHASATGADLRQNRCFLYHVVGNGTGEWQVPVGGMGRLAEALEGAARRAGADLHASSPVRSVEPDGDGVRITLADGTRTAARWLLAGCAPTVLRRLLGRPAGSPPEGSQTKVNLVLRRLPRLVSGLDPEVAFAGTVHLSQGYEQLETAWRQSRAGRLPDPLPCEVYCHTLTDRSILGPGAAAAGLHTLTLFALHTPAPLFAADPDGARRAAGRLALASLQAVLAEPLEDCLLHDADGRPCVEVVTPLDLEAELAMPGGHIFHGDLCWPWLADGTEPRTPAERWGVATDDPRILLAGSGSVRGGAVSGLGGLHAASAVLESEGRAL